MSVAEYELILLTFGSSCELYLYPNSFMRCRYMGRRCKYRQSCVLYYLIGFSIIKWKYVYIGMKQVFPGIHSHITFSGLKINVLTFLLKWQYHMEKPDMEKPTHERDMVDEKHFKLINVTHIISLYNRSYMYSNTVWWTHYKTNISLTEGLHIIYKHSYTLQVLLT